MGRPKRRNAAIAGAREAAAIAATLARQARATRRSRRLTQAALGVKVGLSQSEISYLERGHGARTALETWVAIGIALDRPIAIGFSRDVAAPPIQDAGHLAAQEVILRVTTAAGWRGRFEVPTDLARSRHSTDVVLTARDGRMVLIEVWNRLDDLGAAVRASDHKLAQIEQTGAHPRSCWLFVDTAANRQIVRRYPAILRARFGGSSSAWVRALAGGSTPPDTPGLAWVDVSAGRLGELRLRA
jgi:transcriptional regulator with XRE-family HTH domain